MNTLIHHTYIHPFSTVCVDHSWWLSGCVPQITMETLCRLKPLLPGLSLTVLRALGRSEISAKASCRCWSSMGSDLRPGQRAMVYTALQEVLESGARWLIKHV